jgi:hypothetical protein
MLNDMVMWEGRKDGENQRERMEKEKGGRRGMVITDKPVRR